MMFELKSNTYELIAESFLGVSAETKLDLYASDIPARTFLKSDVPHKQDKTYLCTK